MKGHRNRLRHYNWLKLQITVSSLKDYKQVGMDIILQKEDDELLGLKILGREAI